MNLLWHNETQAFEICPPKINRKNTLYEKNSNDGGNLLDCISMSQSQKNKRNKIIKSYIDE